MEIQSSSDDEESPQTVQVVTIQEFAELVKSLPRKWQPGSGRRLIQGVPPHLRARQPNKRVYDPKIISLGPYHHGKPELRGAEESKYLSLDWFAEGDENKKLHLYNKILEKIDWIRYSYADITIIEKYDDKTLALMMLLDGCFIINLMMNCTGMGNNNHSDWLACRGMAASIQIMISDVFVLENQIPFEVIQLLMLQQHGQQTESLVKSFLGWTLKLLDLDRRSITRANEDPPIHILEACWRAVVETPEQFDSTTKCNWYSTRLEERKPTPVYHTSCHSVMDLKAKGIHFKPSPSRSLIDITFNSHALYGELKLPVQYVSPQTQITLSNLIAYELSPNSGMIPIVLNHVIFMKTLIETPGDVKELQRKGILISSFPNHKQAVKVFTEIDTFGYGDLDIFAEVKYDVEEHCRSRAKTWIADLYHTRFQSPWSTIALCAALLLLILTFLQTFFTINPVKGP